MSDGVRVNAGTGPAIDTHELDSGGGVLVQRQKVQLAGSAFGDLVGVTSGALNVHIADALGVNVANFPANQNVTVTNVSIPVTGTFWPSTQPISGTVSVANFPATQPISGTIAVSNFPATQPISGTVTVSNPYAGDVSDRAGRLLGHVTVDNSTLAITATSLPLPSGAATQATLTDGTQKTQVINFPASQSVTGTVAVSKTPNLGSPVVITTNALTTIYTPASGKAIKLNWLGLASPDTNSASVVATVKLGATTIYQWPLGSPGAFAHSGNRVGAPDAVLTVQLSASGQTVYVNPDIEEI